MTGFGAVLFRALISAIHNLFFFGRLSIVYDANSYTPVSAWGAFVILVPVIGGMGVVFLVKTFAPEARGHGVPEVMDAIFYNEGRIRPVVAVVKSLASALAIGSGSSVGREGPIIQIGASLGSSIGQLIRLEAWQRITLVAAGAGAGIAATFNTPIGGVIFAIELMMPEVSTRTFLPVALATGTATFIGRIFFGLRPAFDVPAVGSVSTDPRAVSLLLLYAILGAVIGVASAAFIRGLHFAEDKFGQIENPYLRHAIGMIDFRRVDVCAAAHDRPLPCRWRGLCHHPGCPAGWSRHRADPCPVVRIQDHRHLAEPRLGLVGRHLLSFAVHGRDIGRGLRRVWRISYFRRVHQRSGFRDGRDGRHGRRHHGGRDDGRHDDLRDDARLWDRHADDYRRGDQHRLPTRPLARKHLLDQTRRAASFHSRRRCTPTCSSCVERAK